MIRMRNNDHGNGNTVSPVTLSPATDPGMNGGRAAKGGDRPLLQGDIRRTIEVLKLLSDETRLRIICQLRKQGETHVQAFCSLLGHQQPAVSHHLRLLRIAGLIDIRRDGRYNFYRMLPGGRFEELLDVLETAVADSANTDN